MSAIGGMARGLSSGIEMMEGMQNRAEDRDLRARADQRAERLSAITEQRGKLDNEKMEEEAAYQKARKLHMVNYYATEPTKDDTGRAYTDAELAFRRGSEAVRFDGANGRVSAGDYMKFGEVQQKLEEEGVRKSFDNFLMGGEAKKSQKFFDSFGLKEARIEGDHFIGTTKDGKEVKQPVALLGAAVNSEIPKSMAAIAKAEAELKKTQAQTGLYESHSKYYTSAANKQEVDKRTESITKQLEGVYGTELKAIEARLKQLDHDESKTDPNMSEVEAAELKKTRASRRKELEGQTVKLRKDAQSVGAIMESAHEAGHKSVGARQAAEILKELKANTNNIILTPEGHVAYQKPGTKTAILLPDSVVPREVGAELYRKAGAPAGAPPKPGAAPQRGAAPAAAAPAAAAPKPEQLSPREEHELKTRTIFGPLTSQADLERAAKLGNPVAIKRLEAQMQREKDRQNYQPDTTVTAP